MKTLNTPTHIEEHRKLMYQFKISYNLPLFDNKLHGYDIEFKDWLSTNKGITDLAIHLENIKKNKSIKAIYHKKGKGRQTIINR
tara:strand:- start:586 stop:837 length:252 start_codon:yes stop_codon:yes gene_type:complete